MIPLSALYRPTLDAFFSPNLPFTYRWRLLAFQPLALLIHLLNRIPCFFSRRTTTIYISTRSGPKRLLIWRPPPTTTPSPTSKLPPLHLDIHGGAFIGGDPTANYRFCSTLSNETGCVVIGASYRFAPRHPFPAAIDDIDDIVSWLRTNAASSPSIRADPKLFTIGGSSAGGNLALAAAQAPACHQDEEGMKVRGCVTFYASIDLRLAPWEKKAEVGVPKKDPMRFLMPLYDTYAGLGGRRNDPRCSPILADIGKLPEKMLLVVPSIDILVHEQLTFVERVRGEIEGLKAKGKGECEGGGEEREIRAKMMEGCFHGWLELPDAVLNRNEKWKGTREEVFEECVAFIRSVHRKYGYYYQPD